VQKTQWLSRVEARENKAHIFLTEMIAHKFAQHVAIVRCDGQVAPFKELLFFQAGPLSVNLPALNPTTDHHHEAAVAVVGSSVAVLLDSTAEFRHRDQDDVLHAITHFLEERGDTARKLTEEIRQQLILRNRPPKKLGMAV
jgi:hypothetical protein